MEALLQVKNLSIGIRKGNELLSAVEDLSFDVRRGEILGILGESGSGKTLTALSIPGLLGENKEVTGGSIRFSDGVVPGVAPRDLLSMSEKELEAIRGKEISFVFQEPFSSLNPLMKAGSQIAETLEIHELRELRGEKDRPRARRKARSRAKAAAMSRAKELMGKLNLPEPEKLIHAYPHRLSGGMCQRVMIALAVICRPRLLIADEPTTALDRNTQSQILSLLKEINASLGTSVLFISHDLELIQSIAGRVLVMYSGRILEEGTTGEVFSHPAHEYTRGLLGSVPSRTKRGSDLAAIPGKIPSLEEGRPRGCPFHPRCGKALPRCKEEFPAARPVSATHTTRCILGETFSRIVNYYDI